MRTTYNSTANYILKSPYKNELYISIFVLKIYYKISERIMNKLFTLLILATSLSFAQKNVDNLNEYITDLKVTDASGKEIELSEYKGKVLLIVNVASKCGYTSQYEGLQNIYKKYNEDGFEVLAFPCNDFNGQEPGTIEQIKQFCTTNFGVTFKLFDKIKVLGDDRSALYERLINNPNTVQGDVKWNFEKFLIDKNGKIVERFRSKVKPESDEMVSAIEKELQKKL